MKNKLSNQDLISRIEKHEASTQQLLDDIEKNTKENDQADKQNWMSLAKMNAKNALDALRSAVKSSS